MSLIYVFIFIAIVLLIKLLKSNKKETSFSSKSFSNFGDNYKSIEEVQTALQKTGLEGCNLIIGIDYTQSNIHQGKISFNGRSLHTILGEDLLNPYENAVSIIGRTLEKFFETNQIPCFGFGDESTRDFGVFAFRPNGEERHCNSLNEVLQEYRRITPYIKLSGPTNFAPLVNKAVEITTQSGRAQYHILVIIADGLVVNERETEEAIVNASNYPLSIVMVGVGDGPFDIMEDYDDNLPQRKFDNFQFVHFDEIVRKARRERKSIEATFALHALMEIPLQYNAIKKLGLIGKRSDIPNNNFVNPPFNPNVVPPFQQQTSTPYPLSNNNVYHRL
ncbi:hypothetical protein ABK040_007922 [Willaertia magna]